MAQASELTDDEHVEIAMTIDKMIDSATQEYISTMQRITTTYKEEFMALNRSVILIVTDSHTSDPKEQEIVGTMVLGKQTAVIKCLKEVTGEMFSEAIEAVVKEKLKEKADVDSGK